MSEAALRAAGRPSLVLTERQAAVYQLVVVAGLEQAEAGRKLGISRQAVHQIMATVNARLEAAGEGARLEIAEPFSRETTPESRAFWEAAEGIGIDANAIQDFIRRYQGRVPGGDDLVALDDRGLAAAVDKGLTLSLRYLDAANLARATPSQLAKVAGTLMTMRQLLKGEATSIVRFDDRRKLSDIAKALRQELDRRPKVIEGTAEVVDG